MPIPKGSAPGERSPPVELSITVVLGSFVSSRRASDQENPVICRMLAWLQTHMRKKTTAVVLEVLKTWGSTSRPYASAGLIMTATTGGQCSQESPHAAGTSLPDQTGRATTPHSVLVGGPLPGRVGIAEEDVDVGVDGNLFPAPHLRPLIQISDAHSTSGRVLIFAANASPLTHVVLIMGLGVTHG